MTAVYRRWRSRLGSVVFGVALALLPAGSRPQPPSVTADGVASHSATLLPDGGLLLAGGARDSGMSDSATLVEPGQASIEIPLADARASHAATLLPDGRVLVTGGTDARGPRDTLELVDAATRATVMLASRLPRAVSDHAATLIAGGRVIVFGGSNAAGVAVGTVQAVDVAADHAVELVDLLEHRAAPSGTLLSDGRVLIAGGQGAAGFLDSAEVWDPVKLVSAPLASRLSEARAGHSATLLPSGDVLIVGGFGPAGRPLASLERFDPRSGTFHAEAVQLRTARARHSTTLLPSGEMLVWGGVDAAGLLLTRGELIDPATGALHAVTNLESVLARQPPAPTLVASAPSDGARGVDTQPLIALRFSAPLRVTGVTPATVSVAGPGGPVSLVLTPAESGLLLLAIPATPLARGTTYTLRLDGLTDTAGAALAPVAIRFTTQDAASDRRASAIAVSARTNAGPPPGDDDTRITRDPRTGKAMSRWQSLPPLMAPPGVTAVSGQVLQLNGEPLANVTFTIEATTTRSDATGRFLLSNIRPGHRVLTMDGRTANTAGATYGIFDVSVPISARQTNVLPYTVWMPKLDTVNVVTFPSPTTDEVVITTPRIPGFEFHLPPGAVVEDRDGRPLTQLSITPIPPDRPPFPLPEPFAMYFTIQPNGASISQPGAAPGGPRGGWVVYPNAGESPARKAWDFWSYEPAGGVGWYHYGKGRVHPNRQRIDPDPHTRIYKITVHGCCPLDLNPPPAVGPTPGGDGDGDPVDLSTGLFVLKKRDLVIQDLIPIVLERTYRPGDPVSRAFGLGASHPYAMSLTKVGGSAFFWQEANLILPDGGRIHYVLTQSGPNWPGDWKYEHRDTPTAFFKSKLTYNAPDNTWDITLKDGTVYAFRGHAGEFKEMRDRYGNRLTLTYPTPPDTTFDALSPIKITSPSGRSIEFVYDGARRIVEAVDNIGRTVRYTYDGAGRLMTVTDPAGGVTQYTYDATGAMETLKDARNIVFLRNEYYTAGADAGRVKKQTLADPSFTYQLAYTNDTQGRITQTDVTNPRGVVRRVTFNASGYSLSDTRALGLPEAQTMTYERDADPALGSLVRAVTDALGRRMEYDYDANGKVIQVRRLAGTPDQITSTFTYEPGAFDSPSGFARPLSVMPSTATTDRRITFSYNGLTQTTITDPRGLNTVINHDAAGQPTDVLTPLGPPAVHYVYANGDLTSVTDRLGLVTTWTYDGVGRRVTQTDPRGRQTSWSWSPVNRLLSVSDPAGGTRRFTYNENGKVLTVQDERGGTTTYAYDAMDRVQTRTDPLTKPDTILYDGKGNVTQYTDRKSQVTTFVYDGLNRLTQAGGPGYTFTNTWDAGSRLTQVTDSVAGSITWAYDWLDRLTTETTALGVVRYDNPTNPADRGYDTLGRRLWMEVPGQARITYTWDPASRLTQIQQGSQIVGINYDNGNRRTLLTLPNGVSTEYQYDLGSRLTAMIYCNSSGELGRLTYTYDPASNRASMGGSFAATLLPDALGSATYDAGSRQVTFGSKVLAYDDNGNLTRTTDGQEIKDFTWDSRNRLTNLSAPGPTLASFAYDAVGRRASKTLNGQTTQFQYDGVDIAREIVGGSSTGYLFGPGIDEPLVRGGSEFYLVDALRSVIRLADPTGTPTTTYRYDAFGLSTAEGTPSANPVQFTGRENDGTGLQYSRARYYDPRLQRFISEDPLGLLAGPSLYAYVGNSPVTAVDPSGLFNTLLHGYISYMAHRGNGDGVLASLKAGWYSMYADIRPGSQSERMANAHGMARPGQDSEKAADLAGEYISKQLALGTAAGQGNAEHAVQDTYSPGHGFDKVWDGHYDGFNDWLKHTWNDLFPGRKAINDAIEATKIFLPRSGGGTSDHPGEVSADDSSGSCSDSDIWSPPPLTRRKC